jgi:hypothetical protein
MLTSLRAKLKSQIGDLKAEAAGVMRSAASVIGGNGPHDEAGAPEGPPAFHDHQAAHTPPLRLSAARGERMNPIDGAEVRSHESQI